MNEIIKKASILTIDWTFRSVPSQFIQLITVNGFMYARSFPIAFILSSSKKETSYEKILKTLKELARFNPIYVITDFEKAFPNSIKSIFPESQTYGCLFHFGQSCWRKIQELGMSKLYKEDIRFRKLIRKYLNLAFLIIMTLLK
ncbi:PKS-NRPS hybrid synthetase [Dictyocoela muelleri]|nr:PKS-NRPS hybrid synthetase [Dictyocoela muelleri]